MRVDQTGHASGKGHPGPQTSAEQWSTPGCSEKKMLVTEAEMYKKKISDLSSRHPGIIQNITIFLK